MGGCISFDLSMVMHKTSSICYIHTPRQKSDTYGNGQKTDEYMYDESSLIRCGEADDALDYNIRKEIKGYRS